MPKPVFQSVELSIDDIEELLKSMKEFNRPVTIDFVNRSIQILSEVKTHPTKIVSDGPMTYRDRLFSFKWVP